MLDLDRRPIGVALAQAAKAVTRSFDDAMEAAGGSLPTWLVLLALANGVHTMQGDVAAAVGIRGPTLTHHLDRLEREGLITRSRPPGNRRVQHLALTEAGHALFIRLRDTAVAFDARLRAGLDQAEVDRLRALLSRLTENASRA